jgi:hypothetical protein
MPRNIPSAVRSGRASTEAIVLKQSSTNARKRPHKTAKPRGSYLPETKVLRIQQRYIAGENKSTIAKAEGCDRETVARIVQFPEVRAFLAHMQEEFYGLLPDAMATIRHALQVENNATVAYRILEATGVAPHKHERLQIPESGSSETGQERQCRLVAAVLLEGNRVYGTPLPDGVAEALTKDSQENEKVLAEKPKGKSTRPAKSTKLNKQ